MTWTCPRKHGMDASDEHPGSLQRRCICTYQRHAKHGLHRSHRKSRGRCGQDYKTSSTIKWITTEELPAPVDMDDALLEWYVADLTADIADVESQLTEATADEKVALGRV